MEYQNIKTQDEFQNELNNRFTLNHVKIISYTKASGPITYQCLECGKIYNKSRANHLYENKTLCSQCYSGKTSRMRQEFLQLLQDNQLKLLDNPNKSLNLPFHIKCLKCGKEYDYKLQQLNNHEFNCRFCGKNGYPISQEDFINRLNNPNFTILKYKNITSSVTIQHNCGYIFSGLGTNLIKNCNCPKCKPRQSKGEQIIEQWLINQKIIYETQKKFKELGNLSYDFFIPCNNLLIEYQGQQHYQPINYFGGEEKFLIQQQHDSKKRQFARDNNFILLEIPYTEINNIPEILESSTTILYGVDSSESKQSPSGMEDDIVCSYVKA